MTSLPSYSSSDNEVTYVRVSAPLAFGENVALSSACRALEWRLGDGKLDPDQISYAGCANTNFKDRLVLRDGRGTDKLNICMDRFGVYEVS